MKTKHGYFADPKTGEPLAENVRIVDGGHHPRKRWIKLNKPVLYVDPNGKEWEVPEDYVFNGASIPRPFWSICDPFHPQVIAAAAVHDYYWNKVLGWVADWLFFHGMRACEYYTVGSYRNWMGVRLWRPPRSVLLTLRVIRVKEDIVWNEGTL